MEAKNNEITEKMKSVILKKYKVNFTDDSTAVLENFELRLKRHFNLDLNGLIKLLGYHQQIIADKLKLLSELFSDNCNLNRFVNNHLNSNGINDEQIKEIASGKKIIVILDLFFLEVIDAINYDNVPNYLTLKPDILLSQAYFQVKSNFERNSTKLQKISPKYVTDLEKMNQEVSYESNNSTLWSRFIQRVHRCIPIWS